jgi:GNAT superfamily N-acetyltransferase
MGNGALAIGPKLPRPSSTLPVSPCLALQHSGSCWRFICRAFTRDGPASHDPFLKLASRLDYYVGSLVRDKRPMPVRALRPSDLPVAIELLRQLGYDIEGAELASRIERVLANATHFAAVAEHGNAVCGLVHAYERPALEKAHEVVVQSLVVDQRARKEGVGKLLMDAAEMWASTKGVRKVRAPHPGGSGRCSIILRAYWLPPQCHFPSHDQIN